MNREQRETQREMNEVLKVNIGAGRERFKGWKSLDLPPEENATFTAKAGDVTLTPDIVAELPVLPFDNESVSMLRMRDFATDYEWGFGRQQWSKSQKLLGEELYRVLKKGGKLIVIDVPGTFAWLSQYFRRVSVHTGGRPAWLSEKQWLSASEAWSKEMPKFRKTGGRFVVTTYVKD